MLSLGDEQPLVLKTLENMIKKGHVPHALIFYGDKSTSKKEMAVHFIKMLYADYYNVSVEKSPVNKRIDDNASTNVFYITRDTKTTISIDSIRGYLKESSVSSLEEGPRVFVFEDADYLNTNSSNAILKFVEEPEDGVYIIFLIERLDNMLETIKSRCSILSFRPLNKEFLMEKLDLKGYDQSITKVLIEHTQKEDAIDEIINSEDYMSIYNLVTDMMLERFETNGSLNLYLNEHYHLLNEPEYQEFFLSLLSIYFKDILNYNIFKNEENLLFSREKGRIKKISTLFTREEISRFIKEILSIKSLVENKQSINLHLYLDNLLLKMELNFRK